MLSKTRLLTFLWQLTNEFPDAIEKIKNARKLNYWNDDEWIYIKDTEVALKMLKKEMKNMGLDLRVDIVDMIIGGAGEEVFKTNKFACDKILECRENLKIISNPAEG